MPRKYRCCGFIEIKLNCETKILPPIPVTKSLSIKIRALSRQYIIPILNTYVHSNSTLNGEYQAFWIFIYNKWKIFDCDINVWFQK